MGYQDLLKQSIKKAKKAFKSSSKKNKKSKKNILKSPRMNSPIHGFGSFVSSPAKYDRLSLDEEDGLNTCKLACCCCLIIDHWGFIRIFYKFDRHNNDPLQYALNQLQKTNCLINEDDPQQNNVQIIQMVGQNKFNQNLNAKQKQQVQQKQNAMEIEEVSIEVDQDLN